MNVYDIVTRKAGHESVLSNQKKAAKRQQQRQATRFCREYILQKLVKQKFSRKTGKIFYKKYEKTVKKST